MAGDAKAKARRRKDRAKQTSSEAGSVNFTSAVPAVVKEVIGRAGTRGEVTQVRCQILAGRDKNKTIRRNVKGPIRINDTLMLTETEIEAQSLVKGRR